MIYGDPAQQVAAVATCFMPYSETIEQAHAIGANVMVVHEPTFYEHLDLDGVPPVPGDAVAAKRALLDRTGITIIRCHDVWDWHHLSEGTFASWARFLGLELTRTGADLYLCDVTPQKAIDFAQHVACRVRELGQGTVRFYGDAERKIWRVRTWGDVFRRDADGGDLVITYDDHSNIRAWIGSEWARDTGAPVVVVNHGVLEEPGVASMTAHLQRAFPAVKFTHLKQGCVYREVTAG